MKDDFFRRTEYVGNQLGKAVPFLKQISCMDVETRETIAILEFVKELANDQDVSESLDLLLTFLEKYGYAHWEADVFSTMNIKLGKPHELVEDARPDAPTP